MHSCHVHLFALWWAPPHAERSHSSYQRLNILLQSVFFSSLYAFLPLQCQAQWSGPKCASMRFQPHLTSSQEVPYTEDCYENWDRSQLTLPQSIPNITETVVRLMLIGYWFFNYFLTDWIWHPHYKSWSIFKWWSQLSSRIACIESEWVSPGEASALTWCEVLLLDSIIEAVYQWWHFFGNKLVFKGKTRAK